jgi:hypothetical protein
MASPVFSCSCIKLQRNSPLGPIQAACESFGRQFIHQLHGKPAVTGRSTDPHLSSRAMAVLVTRVDPRSEEARQNAAEMRALVAELRDKTRAISERGMYLGPTTR